MADWMYDYQKQVEHDAPAAHSCSSSNLKLYFGHSIDDPQPSQTNSTYLRQYKGLNSILWSESTSIPPCPPANLRVLLPPKRQQQHQPQQNIQGPNNNRKRGERLQIVLRVVRRMTGSLWNKSGAILDSFQKCQWTSSWRSSTTSNLSTCSIFQGLRKAFATYSRRITPLIYGNWCARSSIPSSCIKEVNRFLQAYENISPSSRPPECPKGVSLIHHTNYLYGRHCQVSILFDYVYPTTHAVAVLCFHPWTFVPRLCTCPFL